MSAGVAASPAAGWATPLDAVPDPVFAERMLGDGVAIDPLEGVIRAPLAGRIVSVHAARHAVTIESDAGALILIHVGLETVALGGAGFTAHVGSGERVETGARLLTVDLDQVGRAARSLLTPVILTNGDRFRLEVLPAGRLVAAGEPLFTLRPIGSGGEAKPDGDWTATRTLLLPLRHGLHARPAARLAARAREFDGEAELAAADGRSAPALSPVGLLALGLSHGAEVTVRSRGREAEALADALAALIEGGMGEGAPLAPAAPPREQLPRPRPDRLHGVSGVPGDALGPAFRLQPPAPVSVRAGSGIAEERAALAAALRSLEADVAKSASAPGPAGAIAGAHLAFLSDPALLAEADRHIAGGASAASGWGAAIEGFAAALRRSADARLAERADDLRDLERRVAALLGGGEARAEAPAGAILIADELLPSELMELGASGIAGIVTARGGPTSHTVIIAAGMGIPTIVAAGDDLLGVADGTVLLLDGARGTVIVEPAPELIAERQRARDRSERLRAAARARAHEPAATRDGTRVEVFANLGSLAEAQAAAAAGAEGCGLLRTEFLFLDRAAAPDMEEQRASYQAIADALGELPLVVRTLDIGSDKPAPYLPMPAEENPALGLRGIRLQLARPELLTTQLAALARVRGRVQIMLPMVIEAAEVTAVRALLATACAEAGRAEVPPLGIMIETPAAALLADGLAEVSDFFSVGSNDLTQYALAVDRGSAGVAARLDALHPAVLRLIAGAGSAAAARGRWTGVCGGMAADPLAVPILLGLGIGELSVPVAALAETKERVRRLDLPACRALAEQALAADGAAAVRALAQRFWEEREA